MRCYTEYVDPPPKNDFFLLCDHNCSCVIIIVQAIGIIYQKMEPPATSSTDAAINVAILIAIRAASAARIAILVLESKGRSNDLNARIKALPPCLKHYLSKFLIPKKPSLGLFSMTSGSLTFIYPDWTVQGNVVLEFTKIIPDPGYGKYLLQFICEEVRNFTTSEFLPFDSCYQFERVDLKCWTTPCEPTALVPICIEWAKLEVGQYCSGVARVQTHEPCTALERLQLSDDEWAKIGFRLSLFNDDGRWTAQRLESITSLVNKGLEEAIKREE